MKFAYEWNTVWYVRIGIADVKAGLRRGEKVLIIKLVRTNFKAPLELHWKGTVCLFVLFLIAFNNRLPMHSFKSAVIIHF